MKRKNFSPGLLFSLLLILIGVCNGDVAHAQTAETCTLSGTVLHAVTREPMAGITLGVGSIRLLGDERSPMVVPYGDPPATFEAVSDVDGSFHIAGIEPGSRLLLICDDSMAAVKGELPFTLKPGAEHTGITMLVAEGATLGGTVYDESYAQGVAGVVVEAVSAGNRNKGWQRAYRSVTREDGSFRLGGLPLGRYQVRSALDDGFQQRSLTFLGEEPVPYSFAVQWAETYGPIEFTVAPGLRVQGVVVDEDGQPVAGAEVREAWSSWEATAVSTGPDGTFTVLGWEKPEMPNLRARKDNFFSDPIVPDTPENTNMTVEEYGPIRLVLHLGARISGRFIDSSTTTPWADRGLQVNISADDVDFWREYSAEVASDGTFEFSAVQPGTYTLQTLGGAEENSSIHFDAIPLTYGDHATVEFDVGQRKVGHQKFAMASSVQRLDPSELPDLDRVSEPEFTFEDRPIHCGDGFEGLLVELVDPDGYPITNAQVGYTKVENVQPYDSERFRRYDGRPFGDYILVADDLGIFCLGTAPGDIYDIEVQSEYPTHRQQIVAGPGPLTKLRVVVPRGGTVRGRVTLGGAPVAGAELHDLLGERNGGMGVTTDQDGYYTCSQISIHTDRIQCVQVTEAHRMQIRPLTWSPDSTATLNFDFAPTDGSIEGQIVLPPDVSPYTLEVAMILPFGEKVVPFVRLCDEGRFFIPNLPPGTAYLIARLTLGKSPYFQRIATVTVAPGRTASVTIPVDHGVNLVGRIERQGMNDKVLIRAYLGTAESLRDGESWAWPRKHLELGAATVTSDNNSNWPAPPKKSGEIPVAEDHFTMNNIQFGRLTLLCEKTSKPDKGWMAAPTVVGYAEIDVGSTDIDDIVLKLAEP